MNAQLSLLAITLASVMAPQASWAELGGRYESVVDDRTRFHATLKTSPAKNHVVHQLALGNGGEVREFSLADGTVFAIAWKGPARPDLRKLLGARFDVLQADNTPPAGRFQRRALTVKRPDFIVRTGGHSGAFFGVAYLPKSLPQGVTPADLR